MAAASPPPAAGLDPAARARGASPRRGRARCPAAEPVALPEVARGRTPRGEPVRVLIVDDNVDAASTLRLVLDLEGHVGRVVHDGPAALDVAASFLPQVVLLDIGLPGMNG